MPPSVSVPRWACHVRARQTAEVGTTASASGISKRAGQTSRPKPRGLPVGRPLGTTTDVSVPIVVDGMSFAVGPVDGSRPADPEDEGQQLTIFETFKRTHASAGSAPPPRAATHGTPLCIRLSGRVEVFLEHSCQVGEPPVAPADPDHIVLGSVDSIGLVQGGERPSLVPLPWHFRAMRATIPIFLRSLT